MVSTGTLDHLRKRVKRIPGIEPILRFAKSIATRDADGFLKNTSGVIHVGANVGQEISLYEKYNLRVIWIEPIPEVFATLRNNLRNHPRQSAFQYLVTDKDGAEYTFHVSNNSASSSILELKLHKDIWPEVTYDRTIRLRATTLESFLQKERIQSSEYDALVIDTQGSELLVLKGAAGALENFRYIKTEVADFESYEHCCQLKDIETFLTKHGFKEISRQRFARRNQGGSYYNVVYRRVA